MPRVLRALVALLGVGLALTALRIVSPALEPMMDGTVGEVVYDGVLVGSAVLCLVRATLVRAERSAWLLMGLGLASYAGGYGHPAGDALLSRLGARLAEAVAGRGPAYRMGGDEFCVLAPRAPGEGPEELIAAARVR